MVECGGGLGDGGGDTVKECGDWKEWWVLFWGWDGRVWLVKRDVVVEIDLEVACGESDWLPGRFFLFRYSQGLFSGFCT